MSEAEFVYDLRAILDLRERCRRLEAAPEPTLELLYPAATPPRRVGVLAGSFNPLTRGHEELADAAREAGIDAMVLLLPLRAIDKETVTRASAYDRTLVARQWARSRLGAYVALANRGLYVDQAALLSQEFPGSEIVFVVGFDKIVQIFDPRYYGDRDDALTRLFARASFLVAPRSGHAHDAVAALLNRPENRRFGERVGTLGVTPDVEMLSSTVVRHAASRGEPWGGLVPLEAAAFLREAQPYTPPRRARDGSEIDEYGVRLNLVKALADTESAPTTDLAALYHRAVEDSPNGQQLRRELGL